MTFNFPAPTVARHHPAFFWTLLVVAVDTGLKSSLSPLLRLKRGYATAVSSIGKKLVDARVYRTHMDSCPWESLTQEAGWSWQRSVPELE